MNSRKILITALISLNIWAFVYIFYKNIRDWTHMQKKQTFEHHLPHQLEQTEVDAAYEEEDYRKEEDFKRVYYTFPELQEIHRVLLDFKHFLSRSNVFWDIAPDKVLIEGKPQKLIDMMKEQGFYEFKSFALLNTNAEYITFRYDGLLVFDFEAREYRVFYAPEGDRQIGGYLGNESLSLYDLTSLQVNHWYYIVTN